MRGDAFLTYTAQSLAATPKTQLRFTTICAGTTNRVCGGVGDGDVYGTSFRELLSIWGTPSIYQVYEATLLRYVRAGGTVHRTIVVSDEYFDPQLQLLLLRTGMRQVILGLEPLIAHRLDVSTVPTTRA